MNKTEEEIIQNEERLKRLCDKAKELNEEIDEAKKLKAEAHDVKETLKLRTENVKRILKEATEKDTIERIQAEVREFKIKRSKQWDEYYMKIACLAALRSKDPSTPVGACIVDTKSYQIVGIGYNSMPSVKGRSNNDKIFSWKGLSENASQKLKEKKDKDSKLKYPFVVHAAVNAITNRTKDKLDGCTIYVTLKPDEDCARAIQLAGIKEVVYCMVTRKEEREKESDIKTAETFFGANTIETRKLPISNKDGVAKKLNDRIEEAKELHRKQHLKQQGVEQERETKQGESEGEPKQEGEPEESEQEGETEQQKTKQKEAEKEFDDINMPYKNAITWEEFFMGIAILSRKKPRQYDRKPEDAVGACIVSPSNQVMAVGYSGYPEDMKLQDILQEEDQRGYIAHAEYKAIIGGPIVRGCTLYVTSYPCNVCAKLIVQSGISEIVYDKDAGDINARKILRCCLTRECEVRKEFKEILYK
ncbi:PREDICTED: neurofilament medium polypeptide-like [Amphimedon queenslandica]|uniref:dCMP deaminase n=2 Tax=Amphimedon queenslandica TaxID=400682 RepID=A0AAN0JVE4_AMPQE|nr:PREDICTED: neurofilament medium polypeptide-like [Amphimedon queenslandica]|eukprot:XP_019860867.1 PREDICTED: neurofilament medium polypeptide-like [Amphimedon queenslandica]